MSLSKKNFKNTLHSLLQNKTGVAHICYRSAILGISHSPVQKGVGPRVPQNFRDLLHLHTQYEKQQPNFAW